MMIFRKLGLFALVALVPLLLVNAALAQSPGPRTSDRDSNFDLLGDLDMEAEAAADAAPAEDENVLHKFVGNVSGSLRLRGQQFVDSVDTSGNPNIDREDSFGEVTLNLESYTGGDNWRLGMSGWLETGNQAHTYAGVTHYLQDRQSKRRYGQLNESFLMFTGLDLGPGELDITVGKRLLKNGIATLYSPGDRYSATDFTDPMDSRMLGAWQARFDYAFDNFVLTAALLPVYQRSIEPHENSRWLANSIDFSFPGGPPPGFDPALFRVKTDVPSLDADNMSYFARLSGTIAGWDFFVAPFWGMSAAFVQRASNTDPNLIIKDVPNVFNLSAGFATVLFERIQFHGDSLYNWTKNDEDDHFFTGVIGFTYKIDPLPSWLHSDWLEFTIEYAGEKIIDSQDANGFVSSSKDGRLGRNNLLVAATYKVNEDLTFQINAANEIQRTDHLFHVEAKYRIWTDFYGIIGFDEFGGDDNDTFYGRWEDNDRLTGTFEYVF